MSSRDTTGQLVALLGDEDQELASAAAIVLGRLRPSTPRIFRALKARLKEASHQQLAYLLDALAATKNPSAMPILASYLDHVGSASEQSIGLLRGFGKAAFVEIEKAHRGRTSWLGGAWLKVAAGIGTVESIRMVFDFMPSMDWRLARAASIFLRENRASYGKQVLRLILKRTESYLQDQTEVTFGHVTCLKLATDLNISLDLGMVWSFTQARNPVAVRRHALEYLAEQDPGCEEAVEMWPRLLRALVDGESGGQLAGLGVSILREWKHLKPGANDLKRLLDSERPAAVTYALELLFASDPDEAQAALKRLLRSRRATLRHAALASAETLKESEEVLSDLLLSAQDDVRRREVAEHLASSKRSVSSEVFQKIFTRHVKIIREEDHYDRGLLECLAALNRSRLNELCLVRASRWLREGQPGQSVALLQPMVRWRHADREVRFLLAIANLRCATHWNMDDRSFARGLQILGGLARVPDHDIATRLKRSRRLNPDELRLVANALSRRGAAEVRAARRLME